MPVIRGKYEANFSMIHNSTASDSSLTWKARGVLVYLLSKPSDWVIRNSDLLNAGDLGEKGLRSVFDELESNGYMLREKRKNQQGKFEWVRVVYDTPKTILPSGQVPSKTILPSAAPGSGQYIVSTDNNNTENNKKENIKRKSFDDFNRFYAAYPKKQNKKGAMQTWVKLKLEGTGKADIMINNIEQRLKHDSQWRDPQFIPMPSTYLNAERWEDEILIAPQKATGSKQMQDTMDFIANMEF